MITSAINTKKGSRIILGAFLIAAGAAHLTYARKEFRAQVPDWIPLDVDDTVVASGVGEIALGTALISAGKHQRTIGNIAAAFFIGVFPGNISQYVHHRNAFGLNTDKKRFARLFLQPLLVYWALKSTR